MACRVSTQDPFFRCPANPGPPSPSCPVTHPPHPLPAACATFSMCVACLMRDAEWGLRLSRSLGVEMKGVVDGKEGESETLSPRGNSAPVCNVQVGLPPPPPPRPGRVTPPPTLDLCW